MERLTIEYDGEFVPKKMCTIDALGGADDCLSCEEICGESCDNECKGCPVQECFNKLAAYEDTGLTPEQIMEINRMYTEKCQEVTELRNQSCNGCKYEDCSDFDEGGENCNHCSRAFSDEFEAKLAEMEDENVN